MLELDDLELRYGKIPVVRGLHLEVHEGEIVCLVGPNGAGKSTSLMGIAGELKPSRGSVRFRGEDHTSRSVEDIVRSGISMVPEGRRIFTRLTVEENLRLATFACRDRGRIHREMRTVYEQFPILKERRTQPAGRLSGGEQQQLAIARALLTQPDLLLVDEPALGLAPLIVEHIYKLLRELRNSGLTLLIVEQNLQRAVDFADRIYVLRGGALQLSGPTGEFRDTGKLTQAYFGFSESSGA